MIIYRCKEKMKVVFDLEKVERRLLMFIILFILFLGIPLLKEEIEAYDTPSPTVRASLV